MPYATTSDRASLYYQVEERSPEVPKAHNVLMVMGFITEGFNWQPQYDFFTQHGHTCVHFDNRGSGRSDHKWGRYTTQSLARDAMELMKHLNWDPQDTHLVGCSMGGMVALEMLAGLAEGRFIDLFRCTRWRTATLMVTQAVGWLQGTGLPPISKLHLEMVNPLASAAERDRAGMLASFSQKWLEATHKDLQPHPVTGEPMKNRHFIVGREKYHYEKKLQEQVPHPEGVSVQGLVGQVMALMTHSVSDDRLRKVAKVGNKILIISATDDNLVKYTNQRSLATGPLRPVVVEYLELKDTAHAVTEEEPERCNEAMLRLFQLPQPEGAHTSRL